MSSPTPRAHGSPGLAPRLAASATVAALTAFWAWPWLGMTHPDVTIARRAAATLFSPQWRDLYIAHPSAQMGPGAVAASLLPRAVYVLGTCVLLGVFLLLASDTGLATRRRALWWWGASLATVPAWAAFAWKGHVDDALVLVGAALMLVGLGRRHGVVTVAGFAVAVLGKPTAVLLGPLLVGSWGLLAAGAGVGLVVMGPFMAHDPARLGHAAGGIMTVSPESLWGHLGVPAGSRPGWLRLVQLPAAVALGLWAVVRRCPAHALLLGFSLRSLLEMQPAPAYAASVVSLALAADARSPRVVPAFTVVSLGAFLVSQPALDGSSGLPRILLHVVLLAWVCRDVLRSRSGGVDHGRAAG